MPKHKSKAASKEKEGSRKGSADAKDVEAEEVTEKESEVPPPPPESADDEGKTPTSPSMTETAEKIGRALERRKSIEEVQEAGIMKTEEHVEAKARVVEKVEQHIEARPSQQEMHTQQAHIVNPTGASRRLSGSLMPTAVELEKRMTADVIDQHLVSRPDLDELKDQGIVKDGGVAPSLAAAQEQLQRKLAADKVHQHLLRRPSSEQLEAKGVLDDKDIAPSLSATAKKLERTFVQHQVEHLLDSRPDKDTLQNQNILGDPTDAVSALIQDTKHQLERKLKADDLSRQLRKRPSVGELEGKGVVDKGELGECDDEYAKQCSLSRRARYTLALKAASRIAADNLISEDEKSHLKDLILSDNEKVVAALECYELDQNVEELLDTLYRVAKLA